jgi:hypothetical protein
MAAGIWLREPAVLRKHHRLDDRESLARTIGEICIGLLAAEPMEQLPRGIPEVEEGSSIGSPNAPASGADRQPLRWRIILGNRGQCRKQNEGNAEGGHARAVARGGRRGK